MDNSRKRISCIIAAIAVCAAFSGCNDNSGSLSSAVTGQSTASSVTASATTTSAEPSDDVTEPQTVESIAPDTSDSESSSVHEPVSLPAVESSEDTAEVTNDATAEATERPPDTSQAPEQTTQTSQTTTERPAESSASAVTTTEKQPEKPPAEVIIPDVLMPSSPNKDIIEAECAVIDVSNASKGYISVTYNGSAPKVKLRIEHGDTKYNHSVPIDGTTEYYPLSCGSGDYKITLYENAEANLYSTAAEGSISVNIKSDTSPFLYPNCYVKFDKSSQCVRKGAELCAGLTEDIEKIAAIFTYVAQNTSYDKVLAANAPSGYIPFPDRTLKEKKGICYDYSSLFAAMTRSQGIPTRLCIGYASPEIYHAWNEVYTDETGWITPELFLSKKGYNLVDATFYSGAADKSQISDYISNGANYSVIYYY